MKQGIKRAWKIYGLDGHRQGESFNESYNYDWTDDSEIRRLWILNSDKTGTNDYTIVIVERDTYEDCYDEISGQITDGIFENHFVGKVEEIDVNDIQF